MDSLGDEFKNNYLHLFGYKFEALSLFPKMQR